MTRSLSGVGPMAVAVLLLSASPTFAADNWLGTWKLDVAKSKYSPGPAPKSQTLTFASSQGSIRLTSDSVDAQGKTIKGGYTSKFDGQDVPWVGNQDADIASPKRIDDNTYENHWKKGGKPTITSRGTVSRDGKMLTIVQTGKDAQGRTVNTTGVYEKQ